MAMIVFYQRLSKQDADRLLAGIRKFLAEHPRRRVIRVGVGADRVIKVRRGEEVQAVKDIAVTDWEPSC